MNALAGKLCSPVGSSLVLNSYEFNASSPPPGGGAGLAYLGLNVTCCRTTRTKTTRAREGLSWSIVGS